MKKKSSRDKLKGGGITDYTVGDGLTVSPMKKISAPFGPEEQAELDGMFRRAAEHSTIRGRVRFAVEWGQAVIARDGSPESPEERNVTERWYAARILSEVDLVQAILTRVKADPDAAKEAEALARFAFNLGLLVYEAIGFKFPYEKDTLLGIKDREIRKKGGDRTGEKTRAAAADRNAAVFKMNADLLPKHPSERERAAIIARKSKRPVDTIRDILKRSK